MGFVQILEVAERRVESWPVTRLYRVDPDDESAGLADPRHLGRRRAPRRVGQFVEQINVDDDIEGLIGVGQLLRVGLGELCRADALRRLRPSPKCFPSLGVASGLF